MNNIDKAYRLLVANDTRKIHSVVFGDNTEAYLHVYSGEDLNSYLQDLGAIDIGDLITNGWEMDFHQYFEFKGDRIYLQGCGWSGRTSVHKNI